MNIHEKIKDERLRSHLPKLRRSFCVLRWGRRQFSLCPVLDGSSKCRQYCLNSLIGYSWKELFQSDTSIVWSKRWLTLAQSPNSSYNTHRPCPHVGRYFWRVSSFVCLAFCNYLFFFLVLPSEDLKKPGLQYSHVEGKMVFRAHTVLQFLLFVTSLLFTWQ